METVVYVELTDEGIRPVFAPIPAIYLGRSYYKILNYDRDDYDSSRFLPGTFVYCLMTKFEGTENLVPVAYCEISKEAVDNILTFRQR
jgi:hypothetical protein